MGFFYTLYLFGCPVSSSKNGAIKAESASFCLHTNPISRSGKENPTGTSTRVPSSSSFFYKIADHTGNPKTNFRKLDQKIHSCYFQNVA